MLGLTRLFSALTSLADNVQSLASTVQEINGNLRGRLALDGSAETAILTHQSPSEGAEPATEGNGSPATGKGRRRANGAA
jgi:hypothetical protein